MTKYCVVVSVQEDHQYIQPELVSDLDDFLQENESAKTAVINYTNIQQAFTDWCKKSGCTIDYQEVMRNYSTHNLLNKVYVAKVEDIQLFIIE